MLAFLIEKVLLSAPSSATLDYVELLVSTLSTNQPETIKSWTQRGRLPPLTSRILLRSSPLLLILPPPSLPPLFLLLTSCLPLVGAHPPPPFPPPSTPPPPHTRLGGPICARSVRALTLTLAPLNPTPPPPAAPSVSGEGQGQITGWRSHPLK